MRVAWFSPMPPVSTGIAAYSAEIVGALAAEHRIDVFVDEPVARLARAGTAPGYWRSAHEFPWRHRAEPYGLTVYQVGNSSHHDYLWPYLFRYPGLAVLHDVHLHHARAAALLRTKRAGDYREEFAANHPAAPRDLAELAIAGYDSHLYYEWPMTRLVVQASRMTAVHTVSLRDRLLQDTPGARIAPVRLGHGERVDDRAAAAARAAVQARYAIPAGALLLGVFGGLTPEKRLPQVLDAFEALQPWAPASHLLLAGAPARHYDAAADVRRRGLDRRVTLTGYLATDAELTAAIAACDVALCLRWPTARELSGPWLRALGAGRATVITDLAHLAHVPTLDPRTWVPRTGAAGAAPIAVAVDLMDEAHSLRLALRRLAADAALRARLGAAARAWWETAHAPSGMLDDYRELLVEAAAVPAPRPALPRHLRDSGGARLEALLAGMQVANPLAGLAGTVE